MLGVRAIRGVGRGVVVVACLGVAMGEVGGLGLVVVVGVAVCGGVGVVLVFGVVRRGGHS